MLDQYMQRIDDLDRIIQPVAARTQVHKNSILALDRCQLHLLNLNASSQICTKSAAKRNARISPAGAVARPCQYARAAPAHALSAHSH